MTTDKEYEENMQVKFDALAPLLTDEFLSTLVEAAKTCGWNSGDHIETMNFVNWRHEIAGKSCPNLKPHEYGDDGI